ncbi:MAG: ABC transporter ATP-binding protein [Oscillospiraceae bacterium]
MARNKFDIDETLETPFSFKHLKRAGKYIKKHKWKMIWAFVLSISSAIIALTGPIFLENAINVAIPAKNVSLLIKDAIGASICIIFSVATFYKRANYMTHVGQEIIHDIREDLFEHLQKLSFQYYDDRPHGKILTRVINYVNNVSNMLSNGIIDFILEIFNVIVIGIFMLTRNVGLALVVIAGLPLFILIAVLLEPKQRKAWQKESAQGSNLNAYLHESLDGSKITQSFVREKENAEIFDNLNKKSVKAWMKAQAISNLEWVAVGIIQIIVISALYIFGLTFLGATVQIGTLIVIAGYAWKFWQPILNLANLYNNFINSIAYLERIFETLDEPITIDDAPDAIVLPPIVGNVKFDNITFTYDNTKNILEDFNLDIKFGESIAFVGPTGAGKTTIVNLISRFYEVNKGSVLIDGYDVSKVTLNSLRSQMGIMLQDSFIFSGTIMENIKYGRLDATDEEVIEACKTVCAHEFIMEMKDGYETQVNERGSRLSQGQKQLIAFARTLLSNPKILVLDEATSSIDAKTERLLQQGLQALLKNRTSFIIAHRLSTIKNCDKIMYVENKGISESGTHEELIKQQGKYYNLYTSQQA